MQNPLIIDSFMFGNEYELPVLEIRLAELYDTVSHFLLIESNRTQTGLPKPYYYLENKDRFKDWADKIIDIQVDASEIFNQGWKLENWQRQEILTGVQKLHEKVKFKPTDLLVVSDSDEIPEANKLKEVTENTTIDTPTSFNLRFNNYFLNYSCPYRGWWGATMCPMGLVSQGFSPQYLRNQKDYVNKIGVYDKEWFGWHFSNLGGFEVVWSKAKNNVEPMEKWMLEGDRMKEQYRETFNKHVIQDGYYLFLDDPGNQSLKLERLSLDLLPKYVISNRKKFKDLLLKQPKKPKTKKE